MTFDYSARIAGERDLDRQLLLMADMARELLECDRCTLWIVNRTENFFWTKVAHHVPSLKMPLSQGVVGEAYRRRESVLINDAQSSPYFNGDIDRETGYSTQSLLAVPIFDTENEVMGVYQAINKLNGEGFTEEDVRLLAMASTFSGKSLETSILHREVENTQIELVHILGAAGESRSQETGNHVKRVGEYCYLLARGLRLSDDECDLIRLAAPLHDIGKVSVPDSVLNKPGKFDPDEYEIMKRHTTIGSELLSRSTRSILVAAAEIAAHHHEMWNGKGYPHGLSGSDIPLFARICAVADVFDALANDRCYKKAWPLENVEEFLLAQRGESFDPQVIDAYFAQREEILALREKYVDIFDDVVEG